MDGFKVSICSLNQWALDFSGNVRRIIESIDIAHAAGAAYRAGPELEVCGYSLEDAFFEQDTVYHSWIALLDILSHTQSMNIIVDIGMPIFNSALYNCRVIAYKGKILCIRAKTSLAKEGIYREFRHFSPWPPEAGLISYKLPSFVSDILSQYYVPFGADYIMELENKSGTLRIGWEICQELWDPINTSSNLYQNFGCHLILNGSASYWELRKLNTVIDMVKGISLRGGGCYAFSNLVGCDGQRYVFYGRSCIYDRGNLVAMTSTDSGLFDEVQVIHHVIQPRSYEEYRAQMGIKTGLNGFKAKIFDLSDPKACIMHLDGSFKRLHLNVKPPSSELEQMVHRPISQEFEREIHLYVSLWLWDYLRRSKMIGFMMPLSGGLDSSVVAVLVFCMCQYLSERRTCREVQSYFNEVHKIPAENLLQELSSPQKLCNRILKCSYLSTDYSGQDTQRRARSLSESIGASFVVLPIQDIYSKFRNLLSPGSTEAVSLLDQNLQARLRMVATYYLSGGNRIVLATGNVDEGIMGYLTKYDCSSADINPIGGLCKADLRSFLRFCCTINSSENPDLTEVLSEIIDAPPSAELTGAEQRDEDEIGLTYDEISVLGKVRRGQFACSGPKGAFETIWSMRNQSPFSDKIRCLHALSQSKVSAKQAALELADLVKRFYLRYARNRHKLTVLTPALHAETYSPDDNRFDHRHFLYAPYTVQFKCIDEMVGSIS